VRIIHREVERPDRLPEIEHGGHERVFQPVSHREPLDLDDRGGVRLGQDGDLA
jgi:hypothetical protein